MLLSGSTKTYAQLFGPVVQQSGTFNPLVVTSISLPDGSAYGLKYNAYGDLAQVSLPAGGVYQYDYSDTCTLTEGCLLSYSSDDPATGGTDQYAVFRRVSARRVYPNGVTLEGQTCYSYGTVPSTTTVNYYGSQVCTGTPISSESHVFVGGVTLPPPVFYESGAVGKEYSTRWSSATGADAKTVGTAWLVDSTEQNATSCQTLVTLGGSTPASSATFSLYDTYWNVTDTYEYDFGSATAIAPVGCPTSVPAGWSRHSKTSYMADGVFDVVGTDPGTGLPSGPYSNHMRGLANEQDVFGPGDALVAKTTFSYDDTTPSSYGSAPSGYTAPSHTKRGNRTTVTRYKGTTAQPSTTYAYDQVGNVVGITDPRGSTTSISFLDSCSSTPGGSLYAFPTAVTNALAQTVHLQWDCYIGKQTEYTDANGVRTDYSYMKSSTTPEPFGRLVGAKRAVGTVVEAHIAFDYPDLKTATSKADRSTLDDKSIVSTVLYDGLGRKIGTREAAGTCNGAQKTINVDQTYDAKGRPYRVSLPYDSCTGTAHYTTTTYDAASRVYQVSSDDGSTTTTAYNGSIVTTTDPAGVTRQQTTNGLGQLTTVVEDPGTSPHLNYQTTYTYDLLDDLTSVTQGSQTARTFQYNALKQLVYATNLESGTICYGSWSTGSNPVCSEQYDADGNLSSRADARNVTTTYTYDALNRLQSKTYSDGTTPAVQLVYDSSGACPAGATAYNTGKLTSVTTAAITDSSQRTVPGTSQTMAYDAQGRACASSETVGSGSPLPFQYSYNLAGGLTSETYPSGRVVQTTFDVLNRPIGVNSATTTYVNSVNTAYAPQGALSQLQFGPSATPIATQSFTFDAATELLTGITVVKWRRPSVGAGVFLLSGWRLHEEQWESANADHRSG